MISIDISKIEDEELKEFFKRVRKDFETIVVTSKEGNVVMISENVYNNLMENYFLMSNQKMVEHLDTSIQELLDGKLIQLPIDSIDMSDFNERDEKK